VLDRLCHQGGSARIIALADEMLRTTLKMHEDHREHIIRELDA